MKIDSNGGIQLSGTQVNKGRAAFVNIHEILNGYGLHLHAINSQMYVVKERHKYPAYHILIVPERGNWIKDWLEDNQEYYELIGPLKEVIDE